MNVGSTFVPGWIWLVVIVGLVLYAAGGPTNIWKWFTSAWLWLTKKKVSESLDSQMIDFFTKCESGTAVFMLNRIALGFEKRGDKKNADGVREFLPKVSAWKEE